MIFPNGAADTEEALLNIPIIRLFDQTCIVEYYKIRFSDVDDDRAPQQLKRKCQSHNFQLKFWTSKQENICRSEWR